MIEVMCREPLKLKPAREQCAASDYRTSRTRTLVTRITALGVREYSPKTKRVGTRVVNEVLIPVVSSLLKIEN